MKKTFIVLACAALIASCGGGDKKATDAKDTTATTAPATAPTASPAGEKALELIGSSDCTVCHRIHKADAGPTTGPAYSDVAEKYSPAADTTVNRLVKKVISGGTGVWGAALMTPHPSLKEEDVKTIVTYILALKK